MTRTWSGMVLYLLFVTYHSLAANAGVGTTTSSGNIHRLKRSITEIGRYENTSLSADPSDSAPIVIESTNKCEVTDITVTTLVTALSFIKTTTYVRKTTAVTITVTQSNSPGYLVYAREEQDNDPPAPEGAVDNFKLTTLITSSHKAATCTSTLARTASLVVQSSVSTLTVTSSLISTHTFTNTKRLSSSSTSLEPSTGRQSDMSRSGTSGSESAASRASPTLSVSRGSDIDSGPSPTRVSNTISPTTTPVKSTKPEPPLTTSTVNLVFTQDTSGSYVVGTNTLVPGVTLSPVSDSPVGLPSSVTALTIGSLVLPVTDNAIALPRPEITAASILVTANSQGAYVIGGQTLSPGEPPIYVSGTKYSLFTDGSTLVIDTFTLALQDTAAPEQSHVVTIANQAITANEQGRYIVGSQTLAPGGTAITISGTFYSLSPSGTALQVGSSIIPLAPTAPAITVGSHSVTANVDGAYVVDGQNLRPGGTPIIVSGTIYSLSPSGTALQIGSSIVPLAPSALAITVGGHPVTANSDGAYVIDGQTLRAGGSTTNVSGTVYSLFPSGTALQVGSSTIPLTTAKPAVTLGGQALTADAAGDYVIGSQTLKPGGVPITVSGTAISLGKDGNTVVVGGKTEVLASTTSQGIGGLIWSGVGGGGSADGGGAGPAETGVVQFTGAGTMGKVGLVWASWVVVATMIFVTVIIL